MQHEIIVNQEPEPKVTKVSAASTYQPADWFVQSVTGGLTADSGVKVTADSAMTYSSVWQAVNIISQTVAGLPLELYSRDENDDRERDRGHASWVLLNVSPEGTARSVKTSAFSFRETLQAHALLRGNGYAEIITNGAGEPIEMQILPPDLTYPELTDNGDLFYWTQEGPAEKPRMLLARQVFHLRGLGTDGLAGYSVLKLARNSWGLGIGAEKHGSKHFRNDARPDIVLKVAQSISPDKANEIRRGWDTIHQGLDTKTGTAVLSGGVDAMPLAISNTDSQWLESRKFQRTEVASWFNLPPHLLNDDSRTGYNSIVEEQRRFLAQTLQPWLRKWTTECDLKLLTSDERTQRDFYFEHNVRSLIQTDVSAVTDNVVKLIASEVISVNEARRLLNMNRRPEGGDEYRNPNINTTPAGAPAAKTVRSDAQPLPDTKKRRQPYPLLKADKAAIQRLVSERINKLRQTERGQALRATKSPNFLQWLDEWMGSFEVRVVDAMAPIVDVLRIVHVECDASAIARRHIAHEHEGMLEVSGRVRQDKLEDAIHHYFDTDKDWPETLAAEIISDAWNQIEQRQQSREQSE